MLSIANEFGIQPILLLAQIVNFLVLLYLLNRFLFRPILQKLEQRKQIIAKGLEDAQKAKDALAESDLEDEKILKKAKTEADSIVAQAIKKSDEILSQAKLKADAECTLLLAKASDQIEQSRQNMHRQIKQEIGHVINLTLTKLTGKILTNADQNALLKASIKEFENIK